MVKILFVINYYRFGGPSKVIGNIMTSLDKKKYKITLLTLTKGNNEESINLLKENGIEVIQCNYPHSMISIIKNYNKIINIINNISPDIIHTNGVLNSMIVSNNKIDSKKITTVHSNIYEDFISAYGSIKGKMYIRLLLSTLKKYDSVVACSKSVYNSLTGKVNNLYYVNNGIDSRPVTKSSNVRDELKIPKDATVYIYCGALNKNKRIRELVKMFKNNLKPDEYFIILGRGEFFEEIKKYEDKNILVLGYRTNINDYLSSSDIYVSYSASEGFSISVIEALNNGLLLLLSDIPSHNDCMDIDNKVYLGELFNENNFLEKKELLYTNNKKKDKEKIIEFQNKYLSSNSMAKGYDKIYCNAMRNGENK